MRDEKNDPRLFPAELNEKGRIRSVALLFPGTSAFLLCFLFFLHEQNFSTRTIFRL